MNKSHVTAAALLLGLSLSATTGLAEQADRNKPISIEANTVTLNDRNRTSTYQGGVVLTQGTLTLKADQITIREVARGSHVASGQGRLLTFRQRLDDGTWVEGEAERAEYDTRTQTILLTSKARIKDARNDIRGNTISYDARNGFFKANGGSEGKGGRVRVVIQPESENTTRK